MEDFGTTRTATGHDDGEEDGENDIVNDDLKCRLRIFLLLCDSKEGVGIKFLARCMTKTPLDILETSSNDDRFWIRQDEEKGEVLCGLTGISDEDINLRYYVEMWKMHMYFYLTRELQSKCGVESVCTLATNVLRPCQIPSSIRVKDVLNSDSKKRFLIFATAGNLSKLMVRIQLCDEEFNLLNNIWRMSIIEFMLNKKYPVTTSRLGSEVPKPKLLRAKLLETLKTDPSGRFIINPVTSLISLSDEFLCGHWRNQICTYMHSTQSNNLYLPELGAAVPRPCALSRSISLREVVTADPLGRLKISGYSGNLMVTLIWWTNLFENKENIYVYPSPGEHQSGSTSPIDAKNITNVPSSASDGLNLVSANHAYPPHDIRTDAHTSRSTWNLTAATGAVGGCSSSNQRQHNYQQLHSQRSLMDTRHIGRTWITAKEEVSASTLPPGLAGSYTAPCSGIGALLENKQLDNDVGSLIEWPELFPSSLNIESTSISEFFPSPRSRVSTPCGSVTPTSEWFTESECLMLLPHTAPTTSVLVNLKRLWIKDWLPVEFEGFPPSLCDQFIFAFSNEGLVSVQDLLTAQENGQLSYEFLKELNIGCRFGHYNRLKSSLNSAAANCPQESITYEQLHYIDV